MRLIESFEARKLKKRPFVIKLADFLTSVFGSITFFLLNATLFTFWILANLGKIPAITPFDPYPFILLTMIVSLEAIFLSIIVLMSQNRQSFISTIREEMDMQVNLIAEREITKVLEILQKLAQAQKIKLNDPELDEMLKRTDVSYIERSLEKQLESSQITPKEVIKKVESVLIPSKN